MLLEAKPVLGAVGPSVQTDAAPEPVETHHPDVVIVDCALPGIAALVVIPQLTAHVGDAGA